MEDGIKLILQKHAQKDVIEDLIAVAYKVHFNVLLFQRLQGILLDVIVKKNPSKISRKDILITLLQNSERLSISPKITRLINEGLRVWIPCGLLTIS